MICKTETSVREDFTQQWMVNSCMYVDDDDDDDEMYG